MIWTLLMLFIFLTSLAISTFVDDYFVSRCVLNAVCRRVARVSACLKHDCIKFSGILTAIVSGAVLLIMVGVIICEHTFVDSKVEQLQAERNALVYQMNHQLYLGDALGEYNKKIIWMRNMYENPWTSWFQGDYIYEVDPIELK